MNGPGICKSLLDFSKDEGQASALAKAEKWNLVLEEMMECADSDQFKSVAVLKNAVEAYIGINLEQTKERS